MFKRDILNKIEKFLSTSDILLFYGARQVGKTSLMKYIQDNYFSKNSLFFDLENPNYLDLLNKNPDIFIDYIKSYHSWDENNKLTIFIDEVQYLENPTSFLKYIYDNYKNIKLIISGSSTLEIRGKLKDSLVGRLIKFDIYPLNFREFLRFNHKENLVNFVGKPVELNIINEELKFYFEQYFRFGSYPKIVLANDIDIKKEYLKQIYSSYIEKDIKDIGKIRELDKFNKLLQVLANQSGKLFNISEIANTIGISTITVNEWIFLLENTFVIKIIKPFSTNLRGELTKMPKVFFIDNGIRNFIENDYNLNGDSFENSFFNYINNSYHSSKINFYRTQDKKEIDFVLDGVPYELKLNYSAKKISALDYFENKYSQKGNIVTLSKQDNKKYNIYFPWEI
ncbi:MAG: ATP-binding protein [Candidatus Gracilibacteria bacterium]|nr:ATP-binding protein [Candidatus Gracilibacteria bacterium]